MPRKENILGKYRNLRQQLEQERQQIKARLEELNRIFGETSAPSTPAPVQVQAPATAPATAPARRGRPPMNKLGMREAIQQATAQEPLGIRDLVDAVIALGYRFKSKKPANSVGAYLYGPEGKKSFKKVGKGFQAK